jgi:CRISPR-associated protein Cmr1
MSKTQAPPPHADPQQLLTALGTTSRAVAHRIYRCTLVTPMYGGGVKPGVVDRELPFRPTAIRGQLRFWWRLLNRLDAEGRPRSPKALFEAERAIWGGLGDSESLARSNVSVRVRAVEGKIELRPAAKYEGKPHPIWESPGFGYALFPAADVNKNDGGREDTIAVTRTVEMLRSLGVRVQQPLDGNKEKKPADLLQPGASFELHLGFDEDLSEHQRHQVVRALHWWAAFGGLGARNRRGAGAFDVQEAGRGLPIPTMEEIREAGCRLVMRRATKSSMDAWNEAIKLLREFRQGEGLGRRGRGQSKTPGRSFWPEPDSIREVLGQHAGLHRPEHLARGLYPRAFFGLPIITHFKGGGRGRNQDPPDTQLVPVPKGKSVPAERMASPVILRPMRSGNGQWAPAALLLPRAHVDAMGLVLKEGNRECRNLPAGQWWKKEKAAEIEPMKGRGDDPLDAFLAYFQSSGVPAKNNAAPAKSSITGGMDADAECTYERPTLKKEGRSLVVTPASSMGERSKSITLINDDVVRCLEKLSPYARERLARSAPFNRLRITLRGTTFVSLEEYPE